MKLFYKPGACSLASHITLRESGKDFTLDGVDLMKKRLENGDDFFAVNPKGQVPALLLDDGTLLTEGVAIMQYLADSMMAVPENVTDPLMSLEVYGRVFLQIGVATAVIAVLMLLTAPKLNRMTQDDEPREKASKTATA